MKTILFAMFMALLVCRILTYYNIDGYYVGSITMWTYFIVEELLRKASNIITIRLKYGYGMWEGSIMLTNITVRNRPVGVIHSGPFLHAIEVFTWSNFRYVLGLYKRRKTFITK